MGNTPTVPPFRDDGYLPVGLHFVSEPSVLFRFGSSNRQRRRLAIRLKRWLELARIVGAKRFLVDGSFVTAKETPRAIDSVVLLPNDFAELVANGHEAAVELEAMLLTRQPEEIFAAEDVADWDGWVEFFSRNERSGRSAKGTGGGRTMIEGPLDYEKAQSELRMLESRLDELQRQYPIPEKGFTKAGVRKLIARLHEELAVFEGRQEAGSADSRSS